MPVINITTLIPAIFLIFFFMILRFVVSLFNFMSDPKLRRVNKHYRDRVSILIPARNEQDNIIDLLRSIQQQDHQNYEVIILDDNSTDDTLSLCRDFIAGDSRFSIIQGKQLPPDWLGKNYACYQLAKKATGNFLLFIDADTMVTPGLINSALHRMYLKNLGLLSLFGNPDIGNAVQQTVLPLVHYILLNLLPLQLVYLIKSKAVTAASGQFMLFNAVAYHQRQWHREVKRKVAGDAEIMRLVKDDGFSAEVLLANKLLSGKGYNSYFAAIDGFSKDFLAAFNYNVFSALVYLIILIGGPLIVIATLNTSLIAFMCALIVLSRIMISLSAGQSAWKNVLLHPVQLFNLMLIAFLSIQRYLTRTTVWKGRRV